MLAIGAHPDDIEFGCGATLASGRAPAPTSSCAVLTDGSKGTWDPDADLAALVATRQDGAAGGGPDPRRRRRALPRARSTASSTADRGTVERVCAVIRAVRPDVVLGHDPWKRYRLHPDHRRGGRAASSTASSRRAIRTSSPARARPHRPSRLLLFEAQDVDHVEPVDDDAIDAKVDALLCHRSQWRSTMGIDDDGPDADAQTRRVRRHASDGEVADGRPARRSSLIDSTL